MALCVRFSFLNLQFASFFVWLLFGSDFLLERRFSWRLEECHRRLFVNRLAREGLTREGLTREDLTREDLTREGLTREGLKKEDHRRMPLEFALPIKRISLFSALLNRRQ